MKVSRDAACLLLSLVLSFVFENKNRENLSATTLVCRHAGIVAVVVVV